MNHLIVSCVDRKSLDGPKLRNIKGSLEERFQKWIAKIKRSYPRKKAKNVYKGSMWSASLEAFSALPKGESKLWIVSAGLGLVSGADEIAGYKATFKAYKDDSVPLKGGKKGLKEIKKWWKWLTEENLTGGHSRISDLFDNISENDLVVLAMGEKYHQAIYDDLASSNIPNCDIAILGVKKENGRYRPKIPRRFKDFIIPYENHERLRKSLDNCQKTQVHPKTAEELIKYYMRSGNFNLSLSGLST